MWLRLLEALQGNALKGLAPALVHNGVLSCFSGRLHVHGRSVTTL